MVWVPWVCERAGRRAGQVCTGVAVHCHTVGSDAPNATRACDVDGDDAADAVVTPVKLECPGFPLIALGGI